jgi:amino acid permease
MASITFGGGCLAFPSAMKSLGWAMALILFLVVAIFSYYTLVILMQSGIRKKTYNYNGLIELSMGSKMVWFSDINNLILCMGVIMSYQKFIYSFATDILDAFFGVDKNDKLIQISIILFCFLFIQIPLTLLRKIAYLQYVSILGSFALIYSIIVILSETYTKHNISIKTYEIVAFEKFGWDYVNSMAIYLFGFCSHNGMFQVFIELNRPSKNRYAKILNRSFLLEIVLYLSIGFSGYFSFLGATTDNILSNYDIDDKFILVSKISLFICLHCSMAINYNIMRASYESILLKPGEKKFTFFKDLLLSVFTLFICNVFVYFVDSVSKILGIFGGISTVVISYFNPIMIYVLTNNHSRFSAYNLFAYFVLIITSLVGIVSTGYSLVDFVLTLMKKK